MEEFEGLIDIERFLTRENFGLPILIDELNPLVEEICANTNLNKNQAERAIISFFREIRYQMLQGNTIKLGKFGSFQIKCPATTWGKKRRITPVFIQNAALKRKINEK